jgi:hypothetical protein
MSLAFCVTIRPLTVYKACYHSRSIVHQCMTLSNDEAE